MPQQYLQEVNNTFVKGLITEAGPLTFPKDASVDELNMSLLKDGSRRRRLGAALEVGASDSTEVASDLTLISTFDWPNVGGDSRVEFLGVQLGNTIIFYQKGPVLSDGRVDTTFTSGVEYSVDLTTYEKSGGFGADTVGVQATSINGELVLVSSEINPFKIVRDLTTGAFTESAITIRVRDYEWQGDRAEYDEPSADASPADTRKYDTQNTGWTSAATATYVASATAYPALTHAWYSGKDSGGNFSVTEWDKVYSGTTLITNGHFILNLFDKDRNTASGLTGLNETEDSRFTTVASYAGRIFYGGVGDRIYFSQQLIEGTVEIGECFQVNDPTSEEISDLLDTDGGSLRISEAYNITKLHVFGASLLVFADNGVWKVSGVDDVFRATEYSVTKLTDIGLSFPGSFISATGSRPFWWASTGIYTITVQEGGLSFSDQNLTISTIQTFFDEIDSDAKGKCFGEYDSFNKILLWFYPNGDEEDESKVNNVLLLDEELTAFYPWKIEDQATATKTIVGVSFFDGIGSSDDVQYTVVDSSGNTVVDSLGNTVVSTAVGATLDSTKVKLLVRNDSGTLTFGEFSDTEFLDWGEADYSSYAESGYNFMGDVLTLKDTPYITTVFNVTETGWVADGNGYSLVRPSSCLVSHIWDFKKAASSTQQGYRLKNMPVVDESALDTFDYPTTVISTRLRLRGRGKSVRVKFTSEEGKDFHLLGWETIGAKNGTY